MDALGEVNLGTCLAGSPSPATGKKGPGASGEGPRGQQEVLAPLPSYSRFRIFPVCGHSCVRSFLSGGVGQEPRDRVEETRAKPLLPTALHVHLSGTLPSRS